MTAQPHWPSDPNDVWPAAPSASPAPAPREDVSRPALAAVPATPPAPALSEDASRPALAAVPATPPADPIAGFLAGEFDIPELDSYNIPALELGFIRGVATLSEALASEQPVWTPVNRADPTRFVVADCTRSYGLWERRRVKPATTRAKSATESGEEVTEPADLFEFERITPWIAWRGAATAEVTTGPDGAVTPAAESYDVVILTEHGLRKVLPGLPGEVASRAAKVLEGANAGVALPESPAGRAAADNMIAQLGFEEQQTRFVFTACGLTKHPRTGRWFYAAPLGSMTADGPNKNLQAGPPRGSSAGFEAEALGRLDAAHLPRDREEFARAMCAVRDLFQITPTRPDAAAAIIGTVFSAPLMISGRPVPTIQAEKGAGKSVLATVVSAFQTASPISTTLLPISLIKASAVGVEVRVSWARGAVVQCDDWRLEGLSKGESAERTKVARAAITAGFGEATDAKATVTGGARAGRVSQGSTLITGEIPPPPDMASDRAIHLVMAKADFAIDGEGNAYDSWKSAYSVGLANRLWGAYLQWLVRRVEAHPEGLVGAIREDEAARAAWDASRRQRRQSFTVAGLAVGWLRLREFAAENDLEHLLPSEAEVEAALDSLVQANLAASVDVDSGERIVREIRASLEGGTGYLHTPGNGVPDDGTRWGWARERASNGEARFVHGHGPALGWISGSVTDADSSRRIVISETGMRAICERAIGSALPRAALADALRRHVVLGRGGEVTQRPNLDGYRRSGFVFSLASLGLDRSGEALEVVRKVPKPDFRVQIGAPQGVLIPWARGVSYNVAYDAGRQLVIVRATPQQGFAFPPGADTEWTEPIAAMGDLAPPLPPLTEGSQ